MNQVVRLVVGAVVLAPLVCAIRAPVSLAGAGVTSAAQPGAQWPSSRSFQSDGVRIHYSDEGPAWRLGSRSASDADSRPRGEPGEPVLLVPGFWRGTSEWYDLISALVVSQYRVIAYDGRGHGQSDAPLDERRYGAETVADGVRLLDYLGIGRAHVIGYSDGGAVALRIGIDYPDRVRTLILGGYGTPNPMDSLSAGEQTAVVAGIERGDAGPLLRARLPAGWEPPAQNLIRTYNQGLSAEDLTARAASLRGLFSMPRMTEAALAANPVPTLAIVGERDFMRDSVEAMAAVMSGLQVFVVPVADHNEVMGTGFLRQLLTFLSAHREINE